MKKPFFLFLILSLTLNLSAQKKKKTTQKPKSTQTHSSEVEVDYTMNDASEKNVPIKIDTIRLKSGKKYVFLIEIKLQDIGVHKIGGIQDTEEKELLNNFSNYNFEIIKLINYSLVVFENGKTLKMNDIGSSYNAMAYWNGNNNDNIATQEGIKHATEFISAQIGENKESSYVINTRKAREEIEKLKRTDNYTENSKKVLSAILKLYCLPVEKIKNEEMFLFTQSDTKVKTVNSYYLKDNTNKTLIKSIAYNDDGYPTKVTVYSKHSTSFEEFNFIYENGVLSSIVGSKNIYIHYNDTYVLFSKTEDESEETRIYYLENNQLLDKIYTIMNEEHYIYMNSFIETTMEGNCEIQKIDNIVVKRECSSNKKEFPVVYNYTSYQDGNILQFRKTKIVKVNNNTYEKHYSIAKEEAEMDNYKLGIVYSLNDKNLVNSIIYKNDEKTIQYLIEYTY